MSKSLTLMTSAALIYVASGVALLFAPNLLLHSTTAAPSSLDMASLLAQLYGVALIGFAVATWIARRSPVGGIYGRAIVAGNFTNAAAATLVLAPPAVSGDSSTLRVAVLVTGLLAAGFAVLLFDIGNRGATHRDRIT